MQLPLWQAARCKLGGRRLLLLRCRKRAQYKRAPQQKQCVKVVAINSINAHSRVMARITGHCWSCPLPQSKSTSCQRLNSRVATAGHGRLVGGWAGAGTPTSSKHSPTPVFRTRIHQPRCFALACQGVFEVHQLDNAQHEPLFPPNFNYQIKHDWSTHVPGSFQSTPVG